MDSTKKSDLKLCVKCTVLLTDENWNNYDQKVGRYICRSCRKITDKKYHESSPDYNEKQIARYHSRKSAVIHFYGDVCAQCGEDNYYKLTIKYKNKEEINNHIIDWLYNNPVRADDYQVLCYNCSKETSYKDKYALRDKKTVMMSYGNQCVKCGEDKIERLIIDHKNNDGTVQRRQLKYYTGVRMYRWLIKQNFPQDLGLQILCYNCSKNSKDNS